MRPFLHAARTRRVAPEAVVSEPMEREVFVEPRENPTRPAAGPRAATPAALGFNAGLVPNMRRDTVKV